MAPIKDLEKDHVRKGTLKHITAFAFIDLGAVRGRLKIHPQLGPGAAKHAPQPPRSRGVKNFE